MKPRPTSGGSLLGVSADRLLLMIAKAEDEGRHLRDFFTTSEADGGVPDEALSFAVEGLEERGLVSGGLTLLWPELTARGRRRVAQIRAGTARKRRRR